MTQPAGFFDRALEAADHLDSIPGVQGSIQTDVALVTRALRESIRLNTGIRSEVEGLRARLRAQEHGEGPETPAKPSEALLAAARAVLAASVDVPESILTGGREIPLSVVAGYTPEQLAEAGIV